MASIGRRQTSAVAVLVGAPVPMRVLRLARFKAFHLGSLLVSGLLLTLLATQALAAQGIVASVDRNEVPMDSQLRLTVVIEGTQNASPVLPDLPDFRVISRGVGAREVSYVNGAMTQRVSYQYILIPSRAGRFTIGPVTATIDGRSYRSTAFSIRILKAGERPKPQPETFLTVSVSEEKPYVGEQIIYTWRFYRRVRVADARITSLDFGDLVAEELGEVREFDTNYQGVPYRVSELRRSLFAQRPGTVTIEPAELTCEIAVRSRRRSSIFDFGRVATEPKILRSRALQLEVKPLPTTPSGFSGLVGKFTARSSLTKNELKVGESATLELVVQGSGNIQMMREPKLPKLPGFKIYEDRPTTRIDRTGAALRGTRTFRKALVPLAAGVVDLPGIELIFFDPDQERYRTSRTEAIPVQVLPGEESEDLRLTESLNPGAGKVAVRVLADDILPIRTDFSTLRRGQLSLLETVAWASGTVVPPMLVALLWSFGRRRKKFANDAGLRARQAAFRKSMAALAEVAKSTETTVPEAARNTALILRVYVGDRMAVQGEAMTPAEIEGVLVEESVDSVVARGVRESLDRLEALVFGGDTRRFSAKQLAQSVEQIVKEVEGELAGGFRVDGRPSRWFSGVRRRGQ